MYIGHYFLHDTVEINTFAMDNEYDPMAHLLAMVRMRERIRTTLVDIHSTQSMLATYAELATLERAYNLGKGKPVTVLDDFWDEDSDSEDEEDDVSVGRSSASSKQRRGRPLPTGKGGPIILPSSSTTRVPIGKTPRQPTPVQRIRNQVRADGKRRRKAQASDDDDDDEAYEPTPTAKRAKSKQQGTTTKDEEKIKGNTKRALLRNTATFKNGTKTHGEADTWIRALLMFGMHPDNPDFVLTPKSGHPLISEDDITMLKKNHTLKWNDRGQRLMMDKAPGGGLTLRADAREYFQAELAALWSTLD